MMKNTAPVENTAKNTGKSSASSNLGLPQDSNRNAHNVEVSKSGPACPLQAYSNTESAARTAERMKEITGSGWLVVEDCSKCGMIHVVEEAHL